MVAQWFDRFGCFAGTRQKSKRTWPKIPIEERLQRWFEKTVQNSAFMRTTKRETSVALKASVAQALELSSSEVTVVVCALTTELWSAERDFPLAVIRNT